MRHQTVALVCAIAGCLLAGIGESASQQISVTSGGRELVNGEVEIAAGSTVEHLIVRVRR